MPSIDFTKVGPRFVRPELLQHATIPLPLSGVAPRNIMGERWWDQVRKEAYAGNSGFCWACGQGDTKLSAHEVYKTDLVKAKLTFQEVVALCDLCHMFIHIGYLTHQLEKGQISTKYYKEVVSHGLDVLSKAKLFPNNSLRHSILQVWQKLGTKGMFWLYKVRYLPQPPGAGKIIPWSKWRMVFNEKEYPPRYKSEREINLSYDKESL